jgi:DNA-binding transcriptional MerR regulator
MTSEARHSLEQLGDMAGVSPRQIRELMRLGILPAPSSRGRGATYGPEHMDRLRAWKALREKAPSGTTNEQLRVLLGRLSNSGLLRAIAEGKVPFDLLDDQKEGVTFEAPEASGLVARLSREPAKPVSPGERINEAALTYLSSIRQSAGQVRLRAINSLPRLELPIGADRTGAALSLDRMQAALEQYVATHAAEVRVNPPKAETWQRVTIGRDLEISARGPLLPDEIQLLETIGQLLQRAIYRKERT